MDRVVEPRDIDVLMKRHIIMLYMYIITITHERRHSNDSKEIIIILSSFHTMKEIMSNTIQNIHNRRRRETNTQHINGDNWNITYISHRKKKKRHKTNHDQHINI